MELHTIKEGLTGKSLLEYACLKCDTIFTKIAGPTVTHLNTRRFYFIGCKFAQIIINNIKYPLCFILSSMCLNSYMTHSRSFNSIDKFASILFS